MKAPLTSLKYSVMSDNNLLLNILVIEDNPGDYFLLEQLLYATKLTINRIHKADLLSKAKEIIATEDINLIFLDLSLPDSYGIKSVSNIIKSAENIPVIILTGLSDMKVAMEAIVKGAQDYLVKGEFEEKLLSKTIRYSIERKRSVESLRESNERYKYLFNHNPMPMWVYDKQSLSFIEVNHAATQHYGYNREEFLLMSIDDIAAKVKYDGDADRPASSGKMQNKTIVTHLKKNGDVIVVETTANEIIYNGRIGVLVLAQDISESIRLEKELKAQQLSRQRHVTEAVIVAQERERTEIGQELHDNVNQILGATHLYINTAMSDDPNNDYLKRSLELVTKAINEIRKISKMLVTPALKDLGLIEAMEDIIEDAQVAKSLKIDFRISNFHEECLDEHRKLTIFRIAQEQLNNIIKHANASEILIKLTATEKEIILSMDDNGSGFDTSKHRKGVGITNMISRVEMFNGSVNIHSKPKMGCKLQVHLPLEKAMTRKIV